MASCDHHEYHHFNKTIKSTDLDTVEVGQPHPRPVIGATALSLLLTLDKLDLGGCGGTVLGKQVLE